MREEVIREEDIMKKHIKIIAIITLFTLVLNFSPSYAKEFDNANMDVGKIGKNIDQYVEKYEPGLVSCQVAVFNENGIPLKKTYGYKNIEKKILADSDTVYEWGSCSKLLVWVSVMQLYEQGKIDLDEDIREYLPKEFLTKLKYKDEKITMRNLMSHDAGFQESFYENQLATEDELYKNLEEAVKACECFQAYHVGEFTAYSNWGTALAAYIVENVENEDFTSYVNKHIFKPLNMKHTSIDPRISDNDYVKEKRDELKCYYRGANKEDNQDLGTARSYVQLYPAGACVGTIDDFAKFGQAFVSADNPLFEKEETRRKMFEATSSYADSAIKKNCHGLWTMEYEVQVLGHAGNTMGCSSNLVFDPKSNTGMVIMTNEPGETIFNYGLPKILYGSVKDRNNNTEDTKNADISGFYIQKRGLAKGMGSFQQYLGGILPLKKTEANKYSLNLFGFDIGETTVTKIGENSYLMDDGNGMEMLLYSSKTKTGEKKLEMMSTDYVSGTSNAIKFIALVIGILIGVISLVILIVKFIIWIIKKAKHKPVNFCKNITIAQLLWGLLSAGIILWFATNTVLGFKMTAFIGVLIICMAIISLINGYKISTMIRRDRNLKGRRKLHYVIWSLLSIAFTLFVITFQFYNFWNM